jgi:hypothetical protein
VDIESKTKELQALYASFKPSAESARQSKSIAGDEKSKTDASSKKYGVDESRLKELQALYASFKPSAENAQQSEDAAGDETASREASPKSD